MRRFLLVFACLWAALVASQSGALASPSTRAEEMMDIILQYVVKENAQPTEPCVGPDAPGIFTPPGVARAYGLVGTAMYNAWTRYTEFSEPTVNTSAPRPRVTDPRRLQQLKEEVITCAAYRMIEYLLPVRVQREDLRGVLLNRYGIDVNDNSNNPSAPANLARVVTNLLIQQAENDGSNQRNCYKDVSNFTPPNPPTVLNTRQSVQSARAQNRNPLGWSPLVKTGFVNAPRAYLMPHAGKMRPFAITAGVAPFTAAPLPDRDALHAQFLEVVDTQSHLERDGGRLRAIAEYWADGPRTSLPPGHWLEICMDVLRRVDASLDQAVQALFVVSNAVYDAGIAAWHEKRYYASVRPATYIPAFVGPATRLQYQYRGPYCPLGEIEAWEWLPYQAATFVTPPFAEYVSGHSTFSASAATALSLFFGSPNVPNALDGSPGLRAVVREGASLFEPQCFRNGTNTLGDACAFKFCSKDAEWNSENHYWPSRDITLGPWMTFMDAARSSGISRIYGGIHIAAANTQGLAMGENIGRQVHARAVSLISPPQPQP